MLAPRGLGSGGATGAFTPSSLSTGPTPLNGSRRATPQPAALRGLSPVPTPPPQQQAGSGQSVLTPPAPIAPNPFASWGSGGATSQPPTTNDTGLPSATSMPAQSGARAGQRIRQSAPPPAAAPATAAAAQGATSASGRSGVAGASYVDPAIATAGATASRAQAESAAAVQHLRGVLQQANQHGHDVEASITQLSQLLHQKTVECEGLKALAHEQYAPLRSSVRAQYEAKVKSDHRHQTELRQLQERAETLAHERDTLRRELENLQALEADLSRPPTHPTHDLSAPSSLFNRLAPDVPSRGPTGSSSPADRPTTAPVSSWSIPVNSLAVTNPAQRELLNALVSIDERTSNALDRAGVFTLLKVTMARMCTQERGQAKGTFPTLSDTVTGVLRERRKQLAVKKASSKSPAAAVGDTLLAEASQPVPLVTTGDRQRAMALFLANNPGQYDELSMLLSTYGGREAELYAKLKSQYAELDRQRELSADLQTGAGSSSSPSTLKTKSLNADTAAADATLELHARIMLMYRRYNPNKIGTRDLNELQSKYPPEVLLAAMVEKYGPEPVGEERRALIHGAAMS